MGDLVRLKSRYEAYRDDPSETAYFEISSGQLSSLLRGSFGFEVWFGVESDHLRVLIAKPRSDGTCWNVDYTGDVRFEGETIRLLVDRLSVGDQRYGWLMGGRELRFERGQVADRRAREMLERVESVQVNNGLLRFRFQDRASLW